MYNPIKIIDTIGFTSPYLLFLIASIILFSNERYITLIFYIIGIAATEKLVRLIKSIIREPRPGPQIPFMNEKMSGEHIYGFPSGHAAEVMYTLSFMWFSKTLRIATQAFFYFGAFSALCMIYQRWAYKRHTFFQLFFGALFGIIMGWIVSWLSKQRLENKLELTNFYKFYYRKMA